MAAQKFVEDDLISHCGSISGETFASRRRKNTCTLRQHSIDSLAKRLRDHSFDQDDLGSDGGKTGKRVRFNRLFHYYRFLVIMFGGISVGTMFLLRYNITVSILKMVNQTALYMEEHPNKTVDDFLAEGYALGGEFDWDNEIQHMIMSWYMVAYTLPQVAATRLGIWMGFRYTVPLSLGICAISTMLTPMFAYYGWKWVIFLRLINGLGASAVLPMLLSIVESWMPYDQMTLGLTCAQLLQTIMSAVNPLISGYLCTFHWKYSFYVPGAATLIFCVLFFLLVTDRPEDNFFVSDQELMVICGCPKEPVDGVTTNGNSKPTNGTKSDGSKHDQQISSSNDNDNKQVVTTTKEKKKENFDESVYKPDSWTQVFKIPTFYVYIIMWCFYCGAYSNFSFILPTYLRQFLKIRVDLNGIYCFLIWSGGIISAIWPHPFLKLMHNTFGLSYTASRRITHIILCSSVAFTWIYVGAFHEYQLLLLFLNRCFHGSNDIVVTGCLMANYAKAGLSSLVFSMVNTVGNLSVVFWSALVGWILDYTGQSRAGWTWIYCGLGVSQIVFMLLFATIIHANPIRFKNKPKASSTANFDDIHVVVKKNSTLNNFEKLKRSNLDDNNNNNDVQANNNNNNQRVQSESRQI